MQTKKSIARWAVLALILSMAAMPLQGSVTPAAHAASSKTRPHKKVSGDLFDEAGKRVRQGKGNEFIPVVIQMPEAGSKTLQSALGKMGGRIHRTFKNLRAIGARLPAHAVSSLAARDDLSYVSLDKQTQAFGHLETASGADQARQYQGPATGTIDGSGITIAILDSGIYAAHESFASRIIAQVDFTGEGRTDDLYGHGTHVASIAAGNGQVADGAYRGIAPAANIINVRVLDSQGRGSVSAALAGIDWCISNKDYYNIRVLNMSLGTTAVDSYTNDPLCQAVRQAFNSGLVVCAASGNLGKDDLGAKVYGAVHTPGIEPSALTVGAANTRATDNRSDDAVTSFSSRGPTRGYWTDLEGVKHYDNLIKPDLVAPGNKIVAAKSPGNAILAANPALEANVSTLPERGMMYLSGTSMATPVVTGAAALLLERNPSLTPSLVKAILMYTAQLLPVGSSVEQGAGLLNIEGAVRLAGLVRTDLESLTTGDPLLVSAPPFEWTTVAGAGFAWGGRIIQRWNHLSGSVLITQYQGIYGLGTMLADGVMLADGTMLADGVMISDSLLNTILSSDSIAALAHAAQSGD